MLEYRSIKIIQTDAQKGKKKEEKEQNIQDLCGDTKLSDIHIIEVSQGEKRENWTTQQQQNKQTKI